MKVKGTGSRCLLEECVKDNYYARFHPHSYHCCKEMKFIPRLDVNFLDLRRKILTKSVEREMKVKYTRSRCLLEGCVKDNYYARFHPQSYHCCKEMKFIPRLDVNFLDLRRKILTKSVEREMKVKCTRSRCLLEGCVKDNYYARFHLHSYHCCREMNFISRLDVK